MSEVWVPVSGYEGRYEISNHGGIRSVSRMVRNPNGRDYWMNGRDLAQHPNGNGYLHVVLLDTHGNAKTCKIHRLVCSHFVNKSCESHNVVNHLDGNRRNNTWCNLEWTTVKGNTKHAHMLGLGAYGPRCGNAKLTSFQVRLMRLTLEHTNMTQGEIGKIFGVDSRTVSSIHTGVAWRKVI